MGHEIPVEFSCAAFAVNAGKIIISIFIIYIDTEAALKPEHGLNKSVNIIVVRSSHFRIFVKLCVAGGHLAVSSLYCNRNRLRGVFQKSTVKFQKRSKLRI